MSPFKPLQNQDSQNSPFLDQGTLRPREVMELAEGHRAGRRQSQALNPQRLTVSPNVPGCTASQPGAWNSSGFARATASPPSLSQPGRRHSLRQGINYTSSGLRKSKCICAEWRSNVVTQTWKYATTAPTSPTGAVRGDG